MKELKGKKTTGDDDVPGDVLKLLGEDGLRIVTQLINKLHETGQWPKYFTEITTIALKNKPKAIKCSDHRTISLIAHTAKIVEKILRRRIERRMDDVLGEDLFTLHKVSRHFFIYQQLPHTF